MQGNEQTMPVVDDRQVDGKTATIRCRVPEDLVYFDGHFPGNPVVAGVVQLAWVTAFANEIWQTGDEFSGLDAVKFNQQMQPGALFTIKLEWDPGKGIVRFTLEGVVGVYSSGRLRLGMDD
jgi:3-hydroxymyristoyl/3-hydroxydecanoyl-(acyl carrier protein) dehydratase